MKKAVIMVMVGILAVAMMACGKDADAGNRSSSEQSADEALEMLNAEINARIEAEQREAEERAQRAEEGYPEGVIPEREYRCQEILDDQSNENMETGWYTPGALDFVNSRSYELDYTYDSETGRYTIVYSPNTSRYQDWVHTFEGKLDEEGNLIIDCYERSAWREERTKWDVALEDIEWIFIPCDE